MLIWKVVHGVQRECSIRSACFRERFAYALELEDPAVVFAFNEPAAM